MGRGLEGKEIKNEGLSAGTKIVYVISYRGAKAKKLKDCVCIKSRKTNG